MKLVKFLNREDLPFLLKDETIRVCSGEYFRGLEFPIGDPNECVGELIFKNEVFNGSGFGIFPEKFAKFIKFQGAGKQPRLTISNCSFVNDYKIHLFCVTNYLNDQNFSDFCDKLSKDQKRKYDAALQIIDLDKFLYLVSGATMFHNYTNNVENDSLNGLGFGEFFNELTVGSVVYGERSMEFGKVSDIPGPLNKDEDYSWQREFRILFHNNANDIPDVCILKVPGLSSCLKEIF